MDTTTCVFKQVFAIIIGVKKTSTYVATSNINNNTISFKFNSFFFVIVYDRYFLKFRIPTLKPNQLIRNQLNVHNPIMGNCCNYSR